MGVLFPKIKEMGGVQPMKCDLCGNCGSCLVEMCREINDRLPVSDKKLEEREIKITKEADTLGAQPTVLSNENQKQGLTSNFEDDIVKSMLRMEKRNPERCGVFSMKRIPFRGLVIGNLVLHTFKGGLYDIVEADRIQSKRMKPVERKAEEIREELNSRYQKLVTNLAP